MSVSSRPLLPGVKQQSVPPTPVARNLASVVHQARYKRLVRDVVDVLLLLLVDVLFLSWPDSHIPFLSRQVSGNLLVLAHLALMTHWLITRALPRYRARQIAATWSPRERMRTGVKSK